MRSIHLDDRESLLGHPTKGRGGLWVGLVVAAAAVAAIGLGWSKIEATLGLATQPDASIGQLTGAEASLALDHVDAYEQAATQFTQAIGRDARNARAMTGLSRAHALWAQALSFEAADLEARSDEDPARRGEAVAVRREAARHAETALLHAEDAVRHGGDADAEVALADALRLTGDVVRARSRLERGTTLRTAPSAETLRVEALLAAAEAGGDLGAARPKAEEAVTEDPGLIRARLLLARALLAADETEGAQRHLNAVLRRAPGHPAANALLQSVEATTAARARDASVPTGEAPPEPPQDTRGSAGPTVVPASATPPTTTAAGQPGGEVPTGRDYGWYVRQGEDALARRDLGRAEAFLEAAHSARPGGPEALTGLGRVALARGNATGAAAQFRQAASLGYGEAYMGLGDAYRTAGRLRDALNAYEGYLSRLPGGSRASQARQRVDELRRQIEAPSASEEPERPAPEPSDLPAPRTTSPTPLEDIPAVESDPRR
jgi:tetratricopeptide (TPR) repeat protein